jgi:hypothetical protein
MKAPIKLVLILMFFSLFGCADRPSFISIQKVLKLLQKSESLHNLIDVKNVQQIDSYKKEDEFIVEVNFEQHFLLDLKEAAKLMNDVITAKHPELSDNSSAVSEAHQTNLERVLRDKYGSFHKSDIRQRYINLVFKKSDGQWSLIEQRHGWKDFGIQIFQKTDADLDQE